jgi:hypothetical protein
MPSPADDEVRGGLRAWLERGGHLLALAIIAWLLIQSIRKSAPGAADITDVRSLPTKLVHWSTVATPAQVHVRIDSSLSPAQRDWLAALHGSGTRVSWEGDGVLPVAAVAEAIADPSGGTRIWAAAPVGTTLVLEDVYGTLDSVRAGPAGAQFLARAAPAEVRVRAGALVARSVVSDSLTFGRLLLMGRVRWESKFVAAALEEQGWKVDARLALSPKGDLLQGQTAPIDTGRYAAVVVLDSSGLGTVTGIASYVRAGGGLVVSASAGGAPALASLSAGARRVELPAIEPFDPAATEPRRALALTSITPHVDAVPLEWRDSAVAVAARRVERGRVAMTGYHDTWRWRMGGDDDAVAEHRAWWADLVAAVAHVGRLPRESHAVADEVPLVRIVERLGPSSPAPADTAQRGSIQPAWLFGILATALVLQWTSRRLRGAP